MQLTADTLHARVLRRCFWPTTGAPLSAADVLAIADETLQSTFWPQVIASRGDYYISKLDQAITATSTTVSARYKLPVRAYGPIKDVTYVDADGNEYSMPQISLEELGHMPRGSAAPFYNTGGARYSHYFEGDFIGLYPPPDTTEGTLRIRFYALPNSLVLVASAQEITSVTDKPAATPPTYDLGFAADPDTLFDVADEVDVIGGGNAHQILIGPDAIVNFPTGLTARLTTTLYLLGIAVGDWMAATGQTPLVQLPDFMHAAFVLRVAAECLRANGERDEAAAEERAAMSAWDRMRNTSIPRSEAEPQTVSVRNSPLDAISGRYVR